MHICTIYSFIYIKEIQFTTRWEAVGGGCKWWWRGEGAVLPRHEGGQNVKYKIQNTEISPDTKVIKIRLHLKMQKYEKKIWHIWLPLTWRLLSSWVTSPWTTPTSPCRLYSVEQLLQKIVEASALYSKCEINVNTQRHYHLISISHDSGAPNLDLPARSWQSTSDHFKSYISV